MTGRTVNRMSLTPDTALGVALSAVMFRNRYTTDPAPVIAELRGLAGEHVDVLGWEAGLWAGFHEGTAHVGVLVGALLEVGVPGAVVVGRERRAAGSHSTPG